MPPVPNSMDVCDLGSGSGPPRLHTGGANIIWVKKNHDTRGERLQIATYNVRTLLKDEHVQVLEEYRKKQHEMDRDRARRSPKERGKIHNCCTTLEPTVDKQV